MKKISVRFFCGHFEQLTMREIVGQSVVISPVYVINKQSKAESGQYCYDCMKKFEKRKE
jgi:hypothetical protein